MKLVSKAAVLAVSVVGLSTTAMADEANHGLGVSVGVTGGTNGLGVEAGYRFSNHLGVRANTGSYNYDKDFDSDDFDISGKAKLKSVGALLDIYPFGGSFRLSVGMRSNKNEFGGVGTPKSGTTVEVGGEDYPADAVDTLVGSARFKKNSPTATLGWGGKFKTGLHFGFELGVVAQGSPKLSAHSTGAINGNATFQQSLNDQLDEWEDDAKDYKLWPVIQAHLSYSF
jgi:hypothetical protein